MNKPWPPEVLPPEVLDCAKRLAKSLGYEDSHVMEVEGVVEVYRHADSIPFSAGYDNWYWFELDPRDPTVWSALIGKNKVRKVSYWRNGVYLASLTLAKAFDALGRDPGLAVCEAYNMLKGNPRGKAKPPQKFSAEKICRAFNVPIKILR